MEIVNPPPLEVDHAIFRLDNLDRDTVKFHLAQISPEEARLSQLWSDAAYYSLTFERLAKRRETQVYLAAKEQPYLRNTKKGVVEADCSEDHLRALQKSDDYALELWGCSDLWRQRRDELAGYLSTLRNKSSLVSSLAGITRTEMQGAYQNSSRA